ncbi:MAG: L-histidine N(alpha)-methyltransferase [Immundisolibacteraceae bacterium]|nr:L-histidine N(alpha)-methyltransferase [Immundisolibacteraceae bacterium]
MDAKTDASLTLIDLEPELEDFRQAVVEGLSSSPQKTLPCKFFYDAAGSALFDQICNLDEYYPTRTEISILETCADELAELVGPDRLLVEYGSGSSIKIRILLDHLALAAYMPLDISRDHLLQSAQKIADDYPQLDVMPVCADYSQLTNLPEYSANPEQRRVGFFPGSSIGNFTREEAGDFMRNVARQLQPGDGFIVGIDLKKESDILRAAYNDQKGVTAAFNMNLLKRINEELSAEINLQGFAHNAVYNQALGRVEMHLVSQLEQQIKLGDQAFELAQNETIHTENSHKYDLVEFQQLAEAAGFKARKVWTDANNWFSVHYLER